MGVWRAITRRRFIAIVTPYIAFLFLWSFFAQFVTRQQKKIDEFNQLNLEKQYATTSYLKPVTIKSTSAEDDFQQFIKEIEKKKLNNLSTRPAQDLAAKQLRLALKKLSSEEGFDKELINDIKELEAIHFSNLLSDEELHNIKYKKPVKDPRYNKISEVNLRGVLSHTGETDFNVAKQKDDLAFFSHLNTELQKRQVKNDIPGKNSLPGDTYISCLHGSCIINNLYIIEEEFHIFISDPTTKNIPKTLEIHSGYGQDAKNLTLHIHTRKCPQKILESIFEVSQLTSIFSINSESTLMGAISTAVGATFTLDELKIDYTENDYRIILIENDLDENQPMKHSSWNEFFHFMAPKHPVVYLNSIGKNFLLRKAVVGINKQFKIHDFWVESLQGRGKDDRRANSFRKLAESMKRTVLKEILEHNEIEESLKDLVNENEDVKVDDEAEEEDEDNLDNGENGDESGDDEFFEANQSITDLFQSEDNKKKKKLLCYISRIRQSRRVVNEEELILNLQLVDVETKVFNFHSLSLDDQIREIYQCDILLGTHHSLLAHVFFMNSNSTLIEIFPYGYRKRTFENIAQLLGLKYLYWQNTELKNAIFDVDFVKKHKFTDTHQNKILNQPIDWTNIDSRMYWRNQNTKVDIQSILNLIKFALQEKDFDKFLIYMPWEQINNQLIEFKSACAIAHELERVLVLPLIGHRSAQTDADWDFTFKISEFHWVPFEKYFDQKEFHNLPCRVISTNNFRSLHAADPNFTLGTLHFNPIAKATNEQQMFDYFNTELNFPFTNITNIHGRMAQLSSSEIYTKFGNDNSNILGIGATYWMHGFERFQPYPLTQYENYMDHALYRKIISGLKVSDNLKNIVDVGEAYVRGLLKAPIFVSGKGQTNTGISLSSLLESILEKKANIGVGNKSKFIAMHVRRGDYWNKCKRIKSPELRSHCYPSPGKLEAVVQQYLGEEKMKEEQNSGLFEKQEQATNQFDVTLYIATNIGGSKDEFKSLRERYNVMFFEDLFLNTKGSNLDSSHMALIDVELCSRSDIFFGNFYSSFSRSIFEFRESRGLPYLSY